MLSQPRIQYPVSKIVHGPRSKALDEPYARIAKRPLDVTSVLLSAPIVVPLVLILVVCIMLRGGRPFYTQMRVGRSGRPFRMWKLRSMVHDADQRLEIGRAHV